MLKHFQRLLFIPGFLIWCFTLKAQVHEPDLNKPEWSRSYEPFRIAGNLYYVGTYELACYLITTSKGNILINTGLAASAPLIKKNVEALGFKFSDIKILLTTQAHFDHVGAMAEIKKQTGAQFMADAKDADVLSDGGNSDYFMGGKGSLFQPVKPDRLLNDGDTIRLGEMQLVMLHHPGHTKGSCSYLFTVNDEQRSYRVLIANIPSIIVNHFADAVNYPTIAQDYAYALQHMKNIHFDIWVASHAGQFNLQDKHKPGDGYNPFAFIDQAGYDSSLNVVQKQYDEMIKSDKKN